MASNTENVFIWWRHHAKELPLWPLLADRWIETFCGPDLFDVNVIVPMPKLVIEWLLKYRSPHNRITPDIFLHFRPKRWPIYQLFKIYETKIFTFNPKQNIPHPWPAVYTSLYFDTNLVSISIQLYYWSVIHKAQFNAVMSTEFSFEHTNVESNWPSFYRRHFQMHFLEWQCCNVDKKITDVCSSGSN